MEKTLEIKVYDEIRMREGILDEKKSPEVQNNFPVFVIEKRSMLDVLFGGVENYSRPPNSGLIINLVERAFGAFSSKFMVSSLIT